MIFVPCRGGISHNEAEFSSKEQCAKGAQVLLQAVLDYDRQLAERGGKGRDASGPVRLRGRAVRRRLPRRLERQHQAHARSARHHGADRGRRGLVALPFVPFAGWPAPASWPWLIASIVIHLFYFAGLIESYRAGDLGQVYPIARGAAPLMTATMTTLFVGERLGLYGWGGIVLLAAGVLLLSLRGGRDLAKLDRAGGRLCAVHRGDDLRLFGGRRHRRAAAGPGKATAYSALLFVGIAPVVVVYALVRRGTPVLPRWCRTGRPGSAAVRSR